MPALPEFRLESYFARWEFTARYHLTASDAQSMPLADLLALADNDARQRWEALTLGYTESRGLPALRAEIAATYDHLTADDVLCCAGAEEALFLAMQVLLSPGDHAVVITPNYQSAETVPLSICDVTGVPLRPERGWALDLDELRAALRPDTRLVSVNFPNNPTGAMPDEATWRALAALCDERGITLFSDEVYRGLEQPPHRALPQAADLSPGALSLNVMSKAYGLPGLRIGWLACRDRDLLRRLERAKDYTTICNSAPSEILALIALRAREQVLGRTRGIVAANLPAFGEFFAQFPDLFEWAPPQGGCVCFPRYRGAEGAEAMCADLVRDEGVLLLPASIYASALTPVPDDRFRVGVGRSGPQEGLQRWAAWLSRRQQ
jgi:aspartate/methionine/tyrosine aminotransferase